MCSSGFFLSVSYPQQKYLYKIVSVKKPIEAAFFLREGRRLTKIKRERYAISIKCFTVC